MGQGAATAARPALQLEDVSKNLLNPRSIGYVDTTLISNNLHDI